jgi:hypothetical protein
MEEEICQLPQTEAVFQHNVVFLSSIYVSDNSSGPTARTSLALLDRYVIVTVVPD